MTFNVGHVAGGSHAGWKIQKPAPKPWTCACVAYGGSQAPAEGRRQQPAHMSRCSDCGERRP